LVRDSSDELLSALVERDIDEEKTKRKGVAVKPPDMKDIQASFQEDIDHEYYACLT